MLGANFDLMDESVRHRVADSTFSTTRRDNAAISSSKSKLFSVVLPEPLILNQKSSGGNNLKHFRYTRQGHLKRTPNLERAHRA